MEEITIVGLDLAKQDGTVVLRRKLPRSKMLSFFAGLPKCVVAIEIGALGHEVRLIAPAYVKPFVKCQKNDAADAEAPGSNLRVGIATRGRSAAPAPVCMKGHRNSPNSD